MTNRLSSRAPWQVAKPIQLRVVLAQCVPLATDETTYAENVGDIWALWAVYADSKRGSLFDKYQAQLLISMHKSIVVALTGSSG